MRSGWQSLTCVLMAALLAATAGCPFSDPRTSNQGGGTIFTAGTKLYSGRIGDMTADEWQILTDNAAIIASQFGLDLGNLGCWPQLDDDQAAAVVEFLADNNVQSLADLQQLFNKVAAGQVQVPATLLELGQQLAGQGCSV